MNNNNFFNSMTNQNNFNNNMTNIKNNIMKKNIIIKKMI